MIMKFPKYWQVIDDFVCVGVLRPSQRGHVEPVS